MASTDGTQPLDSTAAGGRPRTAAQQRTDREVAAAATGDPAALAAEIERTREDLAGTLDAIADKVSPKRVAKRTSQKVAASVKEGAAAARESVLEGAAAAKEAVRDKTGKGAGADVAALPVAGLPPVEAVVLPGLAPTATSSDPVLGTPPGRTPAVPAYGSVGSRVNTQYVVGGALALGLLVLLLLRRRGR